MRTSLEQQKQQVILRVAATRLRAIERMEEAREELRSCSPSAKEMLPAGWLFLGKPLLKRWVGLGSGTTVGMLLMSLGKSGASSLLSKLLQLLFFSIKALVTKVLLPLLLLPFSLLFGRKKVQDEKKNHLPH